MLQAAHAAAAVKLLGVNGRLSDLLVITKLVSVFECFDTREAALASFAPVAVSQSTCPPPSRRPLTDRRRSGRRPHRVQAVRARP